MRVHSAGLSPFDAHVREGWYKTSSSYSLPIILGWELSGTVVATGSKISRFKSGDAVFAHPSIYRPGSVYAEYAVVQEKEAALKPAAITHEQAAAVSMNALTRIY